MTRAPCDHGTHAQALEFALNVHDDTLQTYEFLKAWREGALDEWPEYYEWLERQQRGPGGGDAQPEVNGAPLPTFIVADLQTKCGTDVQATMARTIALVDDPNDKFSIAGIGMLAAVGVACTALNAMDPLVSRSDCLDILIDLLVEQKRKPAREGGRS